MRLIVPFTRIAPETVKALNATGYKWEAVDVSGSDSAYWELLNRLWNEGNDFCLNEHDIVPNQDTFSSIDACSEPWCVAPFPYLHGTHAGLGVARFRAELMRRVPNLIEWVGTRQRIPGHPPKHWCQLAEHVGRGLGRAGFKEHWHDKVGHVGDCLPSHGCVNLTTFKRKEPMGYVVHTPAHSGSAGIRALHIFANKVRSYGKRVCVQIEWGIADRPDPYNLETVNEWNPGDVLEAVHVYPEGMCRVPTTKNVWWMLNTPRPHYGPEGLKFTWDPCLMPEAPRLQVDIVEKEYFYPKDKPGSGALAYVGKGRLEPNLIPRGAQLIGEWPKTREELGDVLRSADVLFSFDGFSALDLEASICGTPVVLVGSGASDLRAKVSYSLGVSPNETHARSTVGRAFEHHQKWRAEITHDVKRFITACEAKWL